MTTNVNRVDVDVVVIGAGVSGISAALEAAERGARVAVIDAAPRAGGTASGAGGGTCIPGTALQERLGIDDSFDLALEDWLAWGGDTVDVEWAERYLRDSKPLIFDRLADAGVEWVGIEPQEGNRVPRWHRPAGGGRGVMAILEARARTFANITWLLGHHAHELVRAGGRITGVRIVDHAAEIEVSAPAVVVASGGFNNDGAMVAQHAQLGSSAERVLLGGGTGARGEGHRMLQAVDAQFTELDAVWMYPYGTPDYLHEETGRGVAVRGIPGELWINDAGERFHNESLRGGATGTTALLEQPNGRCWAVFDASDASRLILADPNYSHGAEPIRERIDDFLHASPYVESAPSVSELADRMGVDKSNLKAAVDAMNAAITAGLDKDSAFGKPLAGLSAMGESPLFAVRMYPMARKNLGGVRTDLDCRVLDVEGQPISGLFAAGEVAGMAGGRINGAAALEGTAFGPSLYSGMIAGRTAAG